MAGRDINVQISFTEVLNKLVDTVEADQKIPPQEKRSLIDRLRSLAQNDWVRSIGTSLLAGRDKKVGRHLRQVQGARKSKTQAWYGTWHRRHVIA